MRSHRPAIAGLVLALFVPLLSVVPASAGALDPPPIQSARDWLVAQQRPEGDFELASFPGFETPDAILAIATAGQTGSTWSTAEALSAVEAVDVEGVTALDWVDDFVTAGVSAGLEAKVALLVALPLGLDPAAFDPKANGATDLTDALETISPGLFNSFLTARIVESLLGRNVHQTAVQAVCEAQQATGGWSFDADPTATTAPDADTSGFATMALAAAGVDLADPVVIGARGYFEATQDQVGLPAASPPIPSGGFFSFGSLDANATTLAALGYAAGGADPAALPVDPTTFLESQQVTTVGPAPDDIIGRIRSPNDGFGINTFATSQTIQALALLSGAPVWLPVPGPGGRECLGDHSFGDVPPTSWIDNALRWLTEFEIASGFPPDGDFRPTGVFNRAQASLWFSRFFPEEDGADHSFPDVDPWFESGARFIGNPGWPGGVIATGFPPDGEFRGAAPFNRGQAIAWMWKVAGRPQVAESHGFEDGAAWLDPALNWAKEHRIVTGFDDNTFRADLQINRGQGASWFYKLAADPEAWAPTISLPSTIVHTPPAPP